MALVAAGCAGALDKGQCDTDDDCPSSGLCVYDLTRDATYCSLTCTGDSDCPDFQSCQRGVDSDLTLGAAEINICVDRVRDCTTEDGEPKPELCNGLDDDCDGVVDGAGCQLIERCLDDAPCGAFVCTAPPNQPFTVCGPPNAAASVADFEPCTEDTQCRNGLCEAGICAPMCRPSSDECRQLPGPEEIETFCAEGIGPGARPRHNLCAKVCALSGAACSDNEICAWRAVYQTVDPIHVFVCAIPDLDRKPLGAPCSGNDEQGDNECQHGLCFGGVCTRICRRGADDCTGDLGPGFVCETRDLIYETLVFPSDICVSGP